MTGGYVEKSFAPAPADLEAIGAFTRRAFAPEGAVCVLRGAVQQRCRSGS